MRELQTTTPEGITIGDLLGEELYPIYDVEKIVQASGVWSLEVVPRSVVPRIGP